MVPPTVDEVVEVDSGQPSPRGRPTTRCRLRLYESPGRAPVAVVTELAGNPGLSVTTAAECIWRALARRLDTTRFTLIEHYGPESYPYPWWKEPSTYDLVTVGGDGPTWKRLSDVEVTRLIGTAEPGDGEHADGG
jgi:hypothetical protein